MNTLPTEIMWGHGGHVHATHRHEAQPPEVGLQAAVEGGTTSFEQCGTGFPGGSCICPKGRLFLWLQSHSTN